MEHTTQCIEVSVRFVSPNHHGQRIRYTNGPTASQYLRVTHDALRLHIAFVDKNGDTIESINFNSAQVLEYTCEGRAPV